MSARCVRSPWNEWQRDDDFSFCPAMNSPLYLFIALGLAFSFFFSGIEAGVFALSRVRIRRLVRSGNSNAKRLNHYLESPEDFLWTVLAGNTLSNFAVASLVVIGSRA